MNTIMPFIYYLLVRVPGAKEDTEGPSEESRNGSQVTYKKSTVKNYNESERQNGERVRIH